MPRSILFSLLLVAVARAAMPSAEDVLAAAKQRGGLAVHTGTTDGALESALAENGRWLVHGLAGSPDHLRTARQALTRKGMYSLVSIELKRSFAELPYADNLVNLLVADIDSLCDVARVRSADARDRARA